MKKVIARIFEPLWRLLLPLRAARSSVPRAPEREPEPVPGDMPGAAPRYRSPMAAEVGLLSGEDSALVRPYLVAHERRVRRMRRRVLWLAVHGVDLDLRVRHRVAA